MRKGNKLRLIEVKVDALNSQAWLERVSNSEKALQLSKSAITLSEKIDYKKGLAQGLRTLGFSYIRISQHKEALQFLKKSQSLFKELNDIRGQSDVFEYFGIIERSLGNYEKSLNHLFASFELRQQTGYREGEALSLYHLGVTYKYLGDYNQALDYFIKSLSISNEINDWVSQSYSLNNIGLIYFENEDYQRSLEYFNQSLALRRNAGDKWGEAGCLDNIGSCYFRTAQLSASIEFFSQGLEIVKMINDSKGEGNILIHLGNVYKQLSDFDRALLHYRECHSIRKKIGDKKGEAEAKVAMSELLGEDKLDNTAIEKAISLLKESLKIGDEIKSNDLLAKIHYGLYSINKKRGIFHESLAHLETYYQIEREVHKSALNQKILNLEISHRVDKTRQEAAIYQLRNIELAGLNEEIKSKNNNLELALAELKATQTQLIQSEKMASLGELTAGIAHEIQNPLNFVNNFSEVSNELIDEMNEEMEKGDIEEAKALAQDVKQNLEKILHHGQRADAIVKGMLQHSRSTSGQKEPTDINALADEYLRLAYHGLRAKDKSFNATLKTDFDKSIGKIDIVPQDIGRVILNLITNAFYAVTEKSSFTNVSDEDYEPTVWVSTKKDKNQITISVKDNGNGVPQKVLDKIFQPFFTTKPTGQGTGLGLSLSYDIVKAHGGELKVETKEGEYSLFVIILPH
ncbi:MAG: tetratricopeptide repeat protein [Maribacter sp.]|nr:tetratricopeptide repeat protein [Maribacter sp.]